ncbi:MAG: deoxyribodipyrimidine photolyase [Desulfuromonadaceae bacterium]|nr:deoxyribodipyrimidine photolyase [Desulfuromonadaceae bacterium]
MSHPDIPAERIHPLNKKSVRAGKFVLYWMQQSQRAEDNHALEYAIRQANELQLPVMVVFGLWSAYPEANVRHFTFLIEGLRQTQKELMKRGIPLLVTEQHPVDAALGQAPSAALVVTDRGYLRHQRDWRKKVAEKTAGLMVEVESDAIVPVETASRKAEYAAYTLRRKLWNHAGRFLIPVQATPLHNPLNYVPQGGLDLNNAASLCQMLKIADGGPSTVSRFFTAGTSPAKKLFRRFLEKNLSAYKSHHNQPQYEDISRMSPYLHFGQVSPLWLALELAGIPPSENTEAFEEQLLVRRELALNQVWFNPAYDSFSSLPAWAIQTLKEHAADPREHRYSPRRLEEAETHDPYWNACMKEMRHSGFLHNYLRMYWGKKILEWSSSPEEAHGTALSLNNKYFVDGRDANSYTGIGWIFGLHDRPWPSRPIFGKVRSMMASGLERKCDMKAYLALVEKKLKK